MKFLAMWLYLSTFVRKRHFPHFQIFVLACPNIATSVSSQQFKANFLALLSMTNGSNGSFSSEHGVFADVAVLKHFSKKSKL